MRMYPLLTEANSVYTHFTFNYFQPNLCKCNDYFVVKKFTVFQIF